MAENRERRTLTSKDAIILLITIILGLSGWFLNALYAEVSILKVNKLDKSEFYSIIDRSDKKQDLIIQLLRDHEENSRGEGK